MATAIGDLVVRLGMDTKKFSGGVTDARNSLANMAAGAKLAGGIFAGAAAAVVHTVQREMSVMDELGKKAQTFNMTTEAMIGIKHAADLADVSLDGVNVGLRRMMQTIGDAASLGAKSKELEFLGLDPKVLSAMAPEQQMGAIADALSGVADQATRVAIAQKLFGRSGSDLLVMLEGGSAAMREAAADAEYLGLTFSAIDHEKIAIANDEWTRMQGAIAGIVRELAVRFAPILGTAANIATEMFVEVRKSLEGVESGTNAWVIGLSTVANAMREILIMYHEKEAIETKATIAVKRTLGAEQSELNALNKTYGDHLRRIRELEQTDWGARAAGVFDRISNAVRDARRETEGMSEEAEQLSKFLEESGKLVGQWQNEITTFGMNQREGQIALLESQGWAGEQIEELKRLNTALNALEQNAAKSKLGEELNKQFQDPFDAFLDRVKEIDSAIGLNAGVREAAIQEAYDKFSGADKGFEAPRYAGAMERGSAEAYSALLASGRDSDKTAKAHLQVGKMSLDQLRQLNTKLGAQTTVSIPTG